MKVTSFYYLDYPDFDPEDPTNAATVLRVEVGDELSTVNNFWLTYSFQLYTIKYVTDQYFSKGLPFAERSVIILPELTDKAVSAFLNANIDQIGDWGEPMDCSEETKLTWKVRKRARFPKSTDIEHNYKKSIFPIKSGASVHLQRQSQDEQQIFCVPKSFSFEHPDGYVISENDRFSMRYADSNGTVTMRIHRGRTVSTIYPSSMRRWPDYLNPALLNDNEVRLITERFVENWAAVSVTDVVVDWKPDEVAAGPPMQM